MLGHRTGGVLAVVASVLAAAPVWAAEKSPWDGVWVGTLGNSSKIAVTIADNKVTSYSYRGANVGVAYSRPGPATFAFGDGANYSMVLKLGANGAAKATYHGRHGFVIAKLAKQ